MFATCVLHYLYCDLHLRPLKGPVAFLHKSCKTCISSLGIPSGVLTECPPVFHKGHLTNRVQKPFPLCLIEKRQQTVEMKHRFLINSTGFKRSETKLIFWTVAKIFLSLCVCLCAIGSFASKSFQCSSNLKCFQRIRRKKYRSLDLLPVSVHLVRLDFRLELKTIMQLDRVKHKRHFDVFVTNIYFRHVYLLGSRVTLAMLIPSPFCTFPVLKFLCTFVHIYLKVWWVGSQCTAQKYYSNKKEQPFLSWYQRHQAPQEKK